MSPFILRYLLVYVTKPVIQTSDYTEGLLLCLWLFLSQNVMSFGIHHWSFLGEVLGSEVSASLMKLVFDQSLVLSKKDASNDAWTEGKIVNLITTDANRVVGYLPYFHLIWTGPIMVAFCLILLFINLGYSLVPGLALLLLATEAMRRVVQFYIKKRESLNEVLDRRVEISKEALQIIQFIKYYAWEKIFLQRILNLRNEELKHFWSYMVVANGSFVVAMSVPLFATAMTFTVFSLTGHELEAAQVFSSLALFNCLRMPLSMIPRLMGRIPDAMISLNRIQAFLSIQESKDIIQDRKLEEAVKFENATFSWSSARTESSTEPFDVKNALTEETPLLENTEQSIPSPSVYEDAFVMKNVNLQLGRRELVAVTGRVGSGKSSLLSALSGEMQLQSGRLIIGGSMAHCTQSPWIMSGTIKQNVLFGKAFNKTKYDEVIKACALLYDLESLPNKSETAIGEKGVNLSGGQKQRLALARAMYSDCPIILLDDPLSAVDAEVGRHIFDKALRGPLLNDRCRIMATHRLELLPRVDRTVWIDEGEIRGFDTFEALKRKYPEFESLVQDLRLAANEEQTGEFEDTRPAEDGRKDNLPLIEDEYQEVGIVSSKVYKAYASVSGGFRRQAFVLAMLCLSRVASVLNGLVLAWWTSNRFGLSKGLYIGLYVTFGALQYVLTFGFYTMTTFNGLKASKALLENVLDRIFRCPISFFHKTPVGRLLSLFTRDTALLDGWTASALTAFLSVLATILSTISFTSVLFPWMIPAILILLVGCFYYGRYYRRTVRELNRHETVLRSIGMAQATEAITGASTIRGYNTADHFASRLALATNEMSACDHHLAAIRQWLGVRLDSFGNILVLCIAVFIVLERTKLDPSLSGLVMTYALALVNSLAHMVDAAGDVEDCMVPVERMEHYTKSVPQEVEVEQGSDVVANWPQTGMIVLKELTIQYRPNDPPALRNVTLTISPQGITSLVGRTGSGKSTLLATLFRMTPAPITGAIYIDNVGISDVPLSRLRDAIAIVPQDPACWHGTIRDNMDPAHVLPDAQIEIMLRKCTLFSSSSNTEGRLSLTSHVDSTGSNLSLGQRQLLALARALLRNTRLLILDEATSALDKHTNNTILDILKNEVQERELTVLFVAHKIESVKHLGGRVVVLDRGEVVEEGEMEQLLVKDNVNGRAWFQELCEATN